MSGNLIVIPKSSIEKLKAEEMFKKLGYEKNWWKDDIELTWEKKENNNDYDIEIIKYINFDIQSKKYNFSITLKAPCNIIDLTPNVSMDELKAITQQCKELGWL